MTPDYDLLVVGGGVVGTLLTISLTRAGFKVLLIEKGDFTNRNLPSDRCFALSVSSCNLLEALGFKGLLQQYGNPIKGVVVTEGFAGEGARGEILEFKPHEIGKDSFGCMIRERDLLAALDERIKNEKLAQIISFTKVIDAAPDQRTMQVMTSDGESYHAQLMAICDGKQDKLGEDLGCNYVGKSYSQGALSCTIKHTKPNEGVAYQFFMPSGPIAFLPISNHSVSIVWTNTYSVIDRLSTIDDGTFLRELRPVFGTFLGDITLDSTRGSWPLELSLAEELVGGRFALLGDAARKIHPLAGQGLNLGLRDVAAFVEIIQTARQRGEDIGFADVLERYQKWRKFDSFAFVATTDFFNWIYSRSFPGYDLVRQLGTGVIAKIIPFKSYLIKEAAGLAGDIPVLMKSNQG